MCLLSSGVHSSVLIPLCLAIMGVLWFLQLNPHTTISGSLAQTINPFDSVGPREQVAGTGLAHGTQRHKPVRKQLSKLAACLPSNVHLDQIAVYSRPRNVTVGEKLKKLKARCSKGRIVGSDSKEIRFFRVACWGFPPPDYEERQAEQKRELEELKAKYTVIVIGCDPRIP
jgi:hypothetical protein